MWTNASLVGFGVVIEQVVSNGERAPIAYASNATTASEQKYGITKLEVSALVYALEHLKVYLLGNEVTVFTDHKALVQSYTN